MSTIVGGLRARLIRDSLYNLIKDGLTDLGWFDPDRQHAPLQFSLDELDPTEAIPFNSLGLGDDDSASEWWEMGSDMSEHSWFFYVDFFAESKALGLEVSHDIAAILNGRIHAIGRTSNRFNVYDYRQATPPVIAVAEIEDVRVGRVRNTDRPWQKFWYTTSFITLDFWGSDLDSS